MFFICSVWWSSAARPSAAALLQVIPASTSAQRSARGKGDGTSNNAAVGIAASATGPAATTPDEERGAATVIDSHSCPVLWRPRYLCLQLLNSTVAPWPQVDEDCCDAPSDDEERGADDEGGKRTNATSNPSSAPNEEDSQKLIE